jgi:hypothetical protein
MPTPAADGSYPLLVGGARAPRITLTFLRGASAIDKRDWSDTITGVAPIVLKDGSKLERDDVDALDSGGWTILRRYGLIPTAWVEPVNLA